MPTNGVRPVDAAGLVLLREKHGALEVLLGRRHARAGFLPDIYVFPGGRVEPEDSRGEALPLVPAVAAGLARASRRPASAFLKAAFRETMEEAGLRLPASAAARVDFVCRAITPTNSHRRYNTRFLLADGGECIGQLGGDGELEDLGWWPIVETARLNLVDITVFVLAEAVRRRHAQIPPGEEPAVRYSYVGESVRIFRQPPSGVPPIGRP
jgi:8-oxo-dGTP pyrophosphatase MutT (NUDIX family)